MTKLRGLLAGAVIAALATTALAQVTLSPTQLTGNEAWTCAIGGPQGPSTFCNSSLMRNTTGYSLTSVASGNLQTTTLAARYIFTAALTGGVTPLTPAVPFDGQMLEVINGTGSNFTQTITLTASGTQTVNAGAVATLAAGASAEWQYSATTTTWYRVR